jgi:DNA (cytosine-5)-methyltransferase 3A
MNILSLFDGMSCGQIAINRLGIKYDNYFASEIDKYAIKVTKANYPDTKHIGSVVDVKGENLPKIDLLIGGSPCQSFSFAGKRKGMSTACSQEILTLEHYLELKADGFEFEGQSYLFWEYMRLLKETKPKYFLLENVMMSAKWQKILTQAIGIDPIMINSSLLSAQNRKRLYWTNIGTNTANLFGIEQPGIKQPKDKGILLKDVLEDVVENKYFLGDKTLAYFIRNDKKMKEAGNGFSFNPTSGECKAKTITNVSKCRMDSNYIKTVKCHSLQPRSGDPKKGGTGPLSREDGKTYCLDTGCSMAIETNKIRRLTPIECERLQTVPDNYTNHVSDSQRYKMLGNGWTVDVIAYIFKHMEL